MHYSDDDDDQTPRREFAGDDDELVGPRRGGAPRAYEEYDDEDLVGRRRGGQGARRSILDDDDDGAPIHRQSGPGRRDEDHQRASLLGMVRDVPRYLKLLARLARDPRVSKVDKAIVAAVLVYLVSPVDLIPDWIVPVVGHVEDIYLLALALSRLVNNAGMDVLLDHWDGDPAALESVAGLLDRAGALLPGPVRSLVGGRA